MSFAFKVVFCSDGYVKSSIISGWFLLFQCQVAPPTKYWHVFAQLNWLLRTVIPNCPPIPPRVFLACVICNITIPAVMAPAGIELIFLVKAQMMLLMCSGFLLKKCCPASEGHKELYPEGPKGDYSGRHPECTILVRMVGLGTINTDCSVARLLLNHTNHPWDKALYTQRQSVQTLSTNFHSRRRN